MDGTILQSKLFKYGMWWRVFYGSIRTLFGLVLFQFVNTPFNDLFHKVMSHELSEDPAGIFVHFFNSFFQTHFFVVTNFVAFYLIFWGVVDVVLSIQLLRHKKWAFPVSLYLILFFVLYEVFRFFHTHSLVLLSVITVDLFIFWFILREYEKVKRHITL